MTLASVPLECAVSVCPSWGVPVIVTVGAIGLTVTASVLVVVVLRLPSPSFSVAATVSVKLVSFADLIVSVDRFQL